MLPSFLKHQLLFGHLETQPYLSPYLALGFDRQLPRERAARTLMFVVFRKKVLILASLCLLHKFANIVTYVVASAITQRCLPG